MAEEKIVASLIELMEAGSAPWRRPWDGGGGGHPVNLLSGHRYRGANPILLTLDMHIRGSGLPFWCGFAEARKPGIFPRKGSKAVHILRPQLHSREESGEGGEVTLRSWASYRPVAVFNAADLEGPALAALIEARKAAEVVEAKPDFQPPAPNRCWAGDITYIRTTAGWRYLAVWIDLFSRRVVGWMLDHRMEADLVIEALNRGLGLRRVEPETLLLHTDQGSQYRATAYRDLLGKHEIVCSMSAKGCCWDNAVVESFFSTLKLELDLDDNREVPISPQQLQRDLS